jgi:hypothetical protein
VSLVAWVQSYGVYIADSHTANRQLQPQGLKVIQVIVFRRLFADKLIKKPFGELIRECNNSPYNHLTDEVIIL